MPTYLRPTAPIAADAILVGDPGRALLLAQEVLSEPRMSNHARGLWGYSGEAPAGHPLTVQATGIGGPSAAVVLADLAELGLRRAVRVGTCTGFADRAKVGELLIVGEALAVGGSAAAHGAAAGESVLPDAGLTERLRQELGDRGRTVVVASLDAHPSAASVPRDTTAAADMQTAPLLARARSLEIAAAALLIVADIAGSDERLEKEELELVEKRAGKLASSVLST